MTPRSARIEAAAWHDRDALLAKLDSRTVVCSVSGGKDSTAMALYLTRDLKLPDVRFVFADTQWEHPDTYRYIREVLTPTLGHIEWVGYPGGMPSLVKKKGMFPSRVRRFCTDYLKKDPIRKYVSLVEDQTGSPVVNSVGIRAGESEARSKMGEWEWNDAFDCDVWRPLIAWSERDVIEAHSRHGVRPNPLYLRGAERVGCWPCIFSRKKEIEFIADQTPQVIDRIRILEEVVQESAEARYAAKGETFESLGRSPPTFFQAQGARRTGSSDSGMVPIDEVVLWARTARGGKQFELFAPEREQGCVRWGLCEAMQKDDEEAA